jgi:glycosyltransferase involved in cell wall biosynthesis
MSTPIRVVMLMRQFYPLTGGYQNQALRLALEMLKRNVGIDVVTQRQGPLAPREDHLGIPIHRLWAASSGYLAAWSYLASSLLWMVRHRRRIDLIHANRSSSGLVAGLIGRAIGKHVLYKLTRGDEIQTKGLGRTWLGRLKLFGLKHSVDRFVAITEEIRNDLEGIGVPAAKIVRIPNGIDLDDHVVAYDPRQVRVELGCSGESPIVTFVGRLVPAKGLDWLLEVWRAVHERRPHARLQVVGEGPERPGLEARARALGIAEAVTFVGRQSDVYRFLAVTDVFVLPSREEGTSNALLEAMSQAIPVVVADDRLGGNRGVVEHLDSGYLIRYGATGEFAEALTRLLDDPEERRRMGRRARAHIAEHFSIAAVADSYCRLYAELLETPR